MKTSLRTAEGGQSEILDFAASAVAPLAGWMVRSGIGYREFCARLKRVFLRAAVAEQKRQGFKQTETALCNLSGLHRKDVHALMQGTALTPSAESDPDERARRLVRVWLADWHSRPLPFAGPSPSFESLAVSTGEDSALAALAELSRRGVVECRADHVYLVHPDDATVSVQEAGETVAGHLQAVVDQLSGWGDQTACSLLLEGLSPDSLKQLDLRARQAWTRLAAEMTQEARQLSHQDASHGWRGRYRLGLFGYANSVQPEQTAN